MLVLFFGFDIFCHKSDGLIPIQFSIFNMGWGSFYRMSCE